MQQIGCSPAALRDSPSEIRPPRFALQPSRVIDVSSHLLFRAAGILGYLLAVLGVAPLRAGEAKLANPQPS
jgi:hypothetical protein